MMKRETKRGDSVIFRVRKDESDELVEWLNNQESLSDSIRYLIEKEIVQNGINNLQMAIPHRRDKRYWESYKQREEEKLQELFEQKVEERFQEMIKGKEEVFLKELVKREDIMITIQHKKN